MIKFSGTGTEKVEAALRAIVPEVRTLRIDADTTRHKGALEGLLHEFRSGKADVLIGTQMIAKGLHFPEVTLVGIINTDSALNIPDFRAQEQVFQLITQVAGRSGRGTSPGEVIIQTTIPDHSTIRFAREQDFPAFYAEEIETRKAFGFPPFSHLVKLLFVSKEEAFCQAQGFLFREALLGELPPAYFCHPLVPSGHAKIKDSFRFQFFVRGEAVAAIRSALERTMKKVKLPSKISLFVDVDPSSIFF
jgi:primosomal protein N' (replication factor Y)